MAAAAVVGLANGLASCSPAAHPADPGRPVDDPAAVAATGARFLRRDLLLGVPVDVIAGPAVLPSPMIGPRRSATPSPSALPFADQGGQVTYWLDEGARLRRLDALLRK